MKNQYFGDLNDYKKYGLLRALGKDSRLRITVCWTLTEDDTRSDGSRIKYLREPSRWRSFDPVVFDLLRERVLRRGIRRIETVQRSNVLPNCTFFGDVIPDDASFRDDYFERFFRFAEGADLVFFDPDNGLGVKSIGRGDEKSSKYLYLCELERAYRAGHSVLFYQHFPRKPRDEFLRNIVDQLRCLAGLRQVIAFSTSHVAFVLLPQPQHETTLMSSAAGFVRRWGDVVHVTVHPISTHGSCDNQPVQMIKQPPRGKCRRFDDFTGDLGEYDVTNPRGPLSSYWESQG